MIFGAQLERETYSLNDKRKRVILVRWERDAVELESTELISCARPVSNRCEVEVLEQSLIHRSLHRKKRILGIARISTECVVSSGGEGDEHFCSVTVDMRASVSIRACV